MAARLIPPIRRIPAALLGLAAAIGLLAGIDPKLAIVGSIGVAFILIVFTNFSAGVALFAFLSFLEVLHLGPGASVGKLGGAVVAIGWLAKISVQSEDQKGFSGEFPVITVVLGAFLGWIAFGVTYSESHSAVLDALTRYIPNVLMLFVVFTAVTGKREALLLIAGFVLGALSAAAYGVINAPPEELRIDGTALDPNELGSVLVASVALSGAFAANCRRRPELRAAAIAVACLCVVGIFLTVSRGGLIALAASLVAAMIFGGRWRPMAFVAAGLIAAASFYYFAVLAPPAATERLELTTTGEEQLKEGRTTIWQVAERIVEAKPATGVGAGNFPISARRYLLQPGALGRTDLIISEPKVVHNTYLGIAAELGLVGFGLFAIVILFCVGAAIRAARHFSALGDRGGEALARGVTVALIGILVADTFISQEYNKALWIMLGLGPAMLGVARRDVRRKAESEAATLSDGVVA